MLCIFKYIGTNKFKIKGQKNINYANSKVEKLGVTTQTHIKDNITKNIAIIIKVYFIMVKRKSEHNYNM